MTRLFALALAPLLLVGACSKPAPIDTASTDATATTVSPPATSDTITLAERASTADNSAEVAALERRVEALEARLSQVESDARAQASKTATLSSNLTSLSFNWTRVEDRLNQIAPVVTRLATLLGDQFSGVAGCVRKIIQDWRASSAPYCSF